jgi:hypothetical protein
VFGRSSRVLAAPLKLFKDSDSAPPSASLLLPLVAPRSREQGRPARRCREPKNQRKLVPFRVADSQVLAICDRLDGLMFDRFFCRIGL